MSSLVSFRKGQTGRKVSPELAANPFPPPPSSTSLPPEHFAAPTPPWHPLFSLYGRKRAVFSAAHQHFEHFAVFSASEPPPAPPEQPPEQGRGTALSPVPSPKKRKTHREVGEEGAMQGGEPAAHGQSRARARLQPLQTWGGHGHDGTATGGAKGGLESPRRCPGPASCPHSPSSSSALAISLSSPHSPASRLRGESRVSLPRARLWGHVPIPNLLPGHLPVPAARP